MNGLENLGAALQKLQQLSGEGRAKYFAELNARAIERRKDELQKWEKEQARLADKYREQRNHGCLERWETQVYAVAASIAGEPSTRRGGTGSG